MPDVPNVLDADFAVARRGLEVACAMSAAAGERLALFGPSGAGKSTCLEALAGTVPLARGRVAVGGTLVNARGAKVADPRSRGVSFVRQPTTLFPHLSVRANVTYGLAGAARDQRGLVDGLLDDVGLDVGRDAKPDNLSGGQRQRVALARALARPFRLLLLDEPFSAIDAASRARLREVAAAAAGPAGAAAVLVTHDLAEAQAFGDRLGIMEAGRLLQVGPPGDVVRRPRTDAVARLVGYGGLLDRGDGTAFALHPDRFAPGAHPDAGVVVRGLVRAVRAFGPRFACELELEGVTTVPAPRASDVVVAHLGVAPQVADLVELTALEPPVVELEPGTVDGPR